MKHHIAISFNYIVLDSEETKEEHGDSKAAETINSRQRETKQEKLFITDETKRVASIDMQMQFPTCRVIFIK